MDPFRYLLDLSFFRNCWLDSNNRTFNDTIKSKDYFLENVVLTISLSIAIAFAICSPIR